LGKSLVESLGSPSSPGDFWHSPGWLFPHDPEVFDGGIPAKLDHNNQQHIHNELIMDGQSIEPGWLDTGSHSILVNGRPINGQIVSWAESNGGNIPEHPMLKSIYGQDKIGEDIKTVNIPVGTKVRVTGPLVLDCGHGAGHPCNEDNSSTQNVEIHPVYSVDFIQNFTLSRRNADLTGVYSGNMGETYYVNQINNIVWILSLSRDKGQTFTDVFHGIVTPDGKIRGNWAEVPLGIDDINSGTFVMNSNTQQLDKSTVLFSKLSYGNNPQRTESNTLEKLYDMPYQYISNSPSFNTSQYTITVDNFKIEETRAHEDTDYVTLGAEVNNSPLTLRTNQKTMGDVNNGVHNVNLTVGPFGIGLKDKLSFYFGLDNGKGNNRCDGRVASDSFEYSGNQLGSMPDAFSQTKHYHGTDSPSFCNHVNSEYDVTWTIHRVS
jgi:hypothetical protein